MGGREMIEFTERKCIKCIHFPCLKVQCEAQNTEVCDLYETEVSRAIKKVREEGYYDFERFKLKEEIW